MPYLIAFAGCVLAIAGLESLWLSRTAGPLYHRAHGTVMADRPNIAAAAAFYLVYVPGILFFAVRPALMGADWRVAAFRGALFGFFCFATYDLTNLATVKLWSLRVSLIDMAWGTFLTGAVATAGALAALAFIRH
jgi:uncharacterized membrane protein